MPDSLTSRGHPDEIAAMVRLPCFPPVVGQTPYVNDSAFAP
jgi:hypothetical protein